MILATAVSAALVGGALVYGLDHGTAQAAANTAAAPPAPPAEAFAAAPPPAAAPAVLPAPASAASRPDPYESLSHKVDRLGRSPDPVDAFAAYQLVTACVWARDHEGWMARHILPSDRELLPTTQQACGDIASDQIQSRLRWLERAALAGVHHAATEMLREGPDGLGLGLGDADIDAPENASWKQRVAAALDAGVRTCDADSLESRVNAYENGQGVAPDRAAALTYWVAYMECRQRGAGQASAILGNADGVTQRMGRSLTAEQIAQAVSAGHALARDARPLPGDQ